MDLVEIASCFNSLYTHGVGEWSDLNALLRCPVLGNHSQCTRVGRMLGYEDTARKLVNAPMKGSDLGSLVSWPPFAFPLPALLRMA